MIAKVGLATQRIWIVQNGEELPSDPGPPRLLRQALLASELARRGHEVTYWTTTFNHQRKVQRTCGTHVVDDGYTVRLLRARDYSNNVSWTRIRSHQDAALRFRQLAPRVAQPDIIVSGYPTIELCYASISYAAQNGIPSIVDFRDQWPDIIWDQLPPLSKPLVAPVFAHWRRLQRQLTRRATAVTGITSEFIDWAVAVAGRKRTHLDIPFHLAPPVPRQETAIAKAAADYWQEMLGEKSGDVIWGVYAGSLSQRTDVLTVVRAMSLLDRETRSRLRIVICGSGSAAEEIRFAAGLSNGVVFAGRRNAAEVQSLLERADFGIIPYIETSDFLMSYPNKLGELLSYGLPILTSLGGVTGALLARHGLEVTYRAGRTESCARALRRLVNEARPADESKVARGLYSSEFNPNVIYPAYANHVELVASGGPSPFSTQTRASSRRSRLPQLGRGA